jgi:hypothetical protein
VLVTCPAALVLPGAVAVPHDDGDVTLGVVVKVTGSSKATPDPSVTVAVISDVVAPPAGTLVGLAVTVTAGGGGEKNPKASMTILTGTALLLNRRVAALFSGASEKLCAIELAVKLASLAAGGLESVVG